MRTANDLIIMGKQLASDYVNSSKSLNDGLRKYAEANGLNKEEISRVAETANVEAYLSLIDKSEDKYVEFPLADAAAVYSQAHSMDKAAETTLDYLNEFSESYDLLDKSNKSSLDKRKENELTKVAESSGKNESSEHVPEFTKHPNYIYKFAKSLEKVAEQYEQEVYNTISKADHLYENIYQMIKQAVLNDDSKTMFSKIATVIKTATPNLVDDFILDTDKRLTSETRRYFNKVAETTELENKVINTDSELYKLAVDLEVANNKVDEAISAYEKRAEAYNEYLKNNNLPLMTKNAGIFTGVKALGKKFPKLTTAMFVAPAAYLTTKGVMSNKEKKVLDRYKAFLALQQAKQQASYIR